MSASHARRLWLALTALSLSLACSSGGSSGSGTTGEFLDSTVAGLRYEGPVFSGTTTSQGRYQYVPGDPVCFFLGQIPFGCGEARGIVTPIDLFPGADSSDPRVLNVVRFLLSLDVDGDPSNGIDVRHITTVAADAANIDFDQSTVDFGNDPDVLAFVDAQGFDGTLTGTVAASVHFQQSLDDSQYFEQELYGDWMYTRTMEGIPEQATIVRIDEQEVEAVDGDVTEDGDVSFTLAGSEQGEQCFHNGAFEGDELVTGLVDCFVPQPVQAVALVVLFDDFRMDLLDPTVDYVESDLFADWFLVSPFTEEILTIDEGNVADLAATIDKNGDVHFETSEGEDCSYNGQMNVPMDFVSGNVVCSESGAGAFFMEISID
jgi:hypothetical protein